MFFFFFFQAEDGIRDYKVTGVQTCALPICLSRPAVEKGCQAFQRVMEAGVNEPTLILVTQAEVQGQLAVELPVILDVVGHLPDGRPILSGRTQALQRDCRRDSRVATGRRGASE